MNIGTIMHMTPISYKEYSKGNNNIVEITKK